MLAYQKGNCMKSEGLEKIRKFRRQVLVDLYNETTLDQQAFFNKLYGSTTAIKETQIDWAIQQCENSIKENIKENMGL